MILYIIHCTFLHEVLLQFLHPELPDLNNFKRLLLNPFNLHFQKLNLFIQYMIIFLAFLHISGEFGIVF